MAQDFDAFVSYAHGDTEWVHPLAENLERLGLRVFLDAWELVAGDLVAVKLQKGLARAGAVVFVVSPRSVRRGWVNEEFAAAVAGAAGGRQRLIPVLAPGEVALPPLVAARLYVDFRTVDSPGEYEAKVRELVAAIRSQPAVSRPEPDGRIVPPPGAYWAEDTPPRGLEEHQQGPGGVTLPEVDLLPVGVPRQVSKIRGRGAVVGRLRALIRGGGRQRVWVLAGVGGIGKSRVAAEAACAAEAEGWHVWWVNASDPTSLAGGMLRILEKLGADPGLKASVQERRKTAAEGTWDFLNSTHPDGRWLLVFDNADSPEVLAVPEEKTPAGGHGWLPSHPSGVVIVTARTHDVHWWGSYKVERLRPLDPAAAGRVLCDLAPAAGNLAEAIPLGERLSCLPLALQLAGYLLAGARSPWQSFAGYLDALKGLKLPTALAYLDMSGSEDRATLHRTWELSLSALAARGRAQARPILMLLACFAPRTPIPISMVNDPELLAPLLGSAERPPDAAIDESAALELRFWDGLGALEEVDLIEKDQGSIQVLPVIAEVTRIRLRVTGGSDLPAVGSTAVRMLDAATRRLFSGSRADGDMLPLYVPHIAALLETIADKLDADSLTMLLGISGQAIQQLMTKNPAVAEHLARASISALSQSGDDGSRAVAFRLALADAVRYQSRYQEAVQLLELLAEEQRLPHLDPQEILKTRLALGTAIEYQGRYKDAEGLYHRLLEEIATPNNTDPLTTDTQFRLGFAIGLRDRARARESEELFHGVLHDRQQRLPRGEHRDAHTVQACHGIAWSWALQGRWEEAEAKFRKVLADRKALLGPDDTQTMATRYRIGWVLAGQERYRAAAQALSEVTADQRRILGYDHQATLRSRYRHARALFDQQTAERREEAEELFSRLLEDQRKVLSDAHQATLRTRYRLALASKERGDREEARRRLAELLRDQQKHIGGDHPDTRDTRDVLAALGS